MYKTTFQKFIYFINRSLTNATVPKHAFGNLFLALLVFVLSSNGIPDWKKNQGKNFKSWEWEKIKPNTEGDNPWSKRAGLQALNHRGKFYIFGGRTPIASDVPGASIIHGDVWKSRNKGKTWKKILESNIPFPVPPNHWANRAYFQAVSKGKYMYIIGGQDFNILTVGNPDYPDDCPEPPFPGAPEPPCEPTVQIPFSQFFNDVWRSRDGVSWENMTAGMDPLKRWEGRAGLSAVVFNDEIYVMGGSVNDDASIIGGPPTRIYFNDVWKSRNGRKWTRLTEEAPWGKRAGGIAVVKDGYMYMIGGEFGFTCPFDPNFPPTEQPPCLDPPYYNDVWRSKDGKKWEKVTDNAAWTKRPGHQVVVAQDRLVLFGGFGLGPDNGISPANPSDVWISNKGKVWKKVSDAPWNAEGSKDIKYDFDAVVVKGYKKNQDAIYTFGGDRETFNFFDPFNYLNVDNDVWKFSLPEKEIEEEIEKERVLALYANYPNPFTSSTTLKYSIPNRSYVSINIYDRHGRFVSRLVGKTQNEGAYEINWDARNYKNKPVRNGLYYATLWSRGKAKTIKLYKN